MTLPATVYVVASALILIWCVFLAGQIARVRTAPPSFTGLTALCGLLVAPAALIAMATSSILYARAIHVIAWVWPLTLILFALQAAYATSRRLVTPFIGIPIVAYNTLLAVIGVAKYAVSLGATPPQFLLALVAAHATSLGLVFGRAALVSPFLLQLPILGPAFPARWAVSATVRATLAAVAAASTALIIGQFPNGVLAVRSYLRYDEARPQERPDDNFAIGLAIFPTLTDGPPPLALRGDLALVDSLDVAAIAITLTPRAARSATALDSISRSLEGARADSTLLIVTIGWGGAAARSPLARGGERRFVAQRMRELEEVTRRLRPDYVLPARDPYGEGTRALGMQPLEFWTRYLTEAEAVVRRVRPRTRVAVGLSPVSSRDSALYAWAASPASPVSAVGFTLFPSFSGARALDTRTRAATRWMDATPVPRKEHWVFAAGGYPLVHGEWSQVRALRGTLAWATSRPEVRGLIIAGAGDYDAVTGLRSPDGRLRRAVAEAVRAERGLREAAGR